MFVTSHQDYYFIVMTQSFRFAHVSDIHLPTFAKDCANPALMLNKRFFSALSWFGKRRFIHDKAVTDHLISDMQTSQVDHVLVTGDLVNLSLPDEYTRAAHWLSTLGTPESVSAIPGNHDRMRDSALTRTGLDAYAAYMSGDDPDHEARFPYVKRRQDVLMIGLSSSIATPVGWCSGRLGEAQRERLRDILSQAQKENLCRIVALHHPPAGPQKPHKGLEDHQQLADIIAQTGAELILHGHTHQSSMHALPGPQGPVPVMGVASLSVRPDKGYQPGCWHEYTITRRDQTWDIALDVHRFAGFNAPTKRVAQALLSHG